MSILVLCVYTVVVDKFPSQLHAPKLTHFLHLSRNIYILYAGERGGAGSKKSPPPPTSFGNWKLEACDSRPENIADRTTGDVLFVLHLIFGGGRFM